MRFFTRRTPATHGHTTWSVQSFGIALAFLTRLRLPGDTPCLLSAHSIAASVAWFPFIGLLLGILCAGPLLACALLAGKAELSWLWAWAYVVVGFYLTRGLHWDGLADIADAWGSGAEGPRFWEIVKDSRLGAFGAMGQMLAFSGLLVAAQAHLHQALGGALTLWTWLPHCVALLVAPCLGRCACLLLAALTSPRDALSLGGMACAGASLRCATAWAAVLCCCLLLLYPLKTVLLLIVVLAVLLLTLRRMACRHGGCNGDFLGCAIVLAELFSLVTLLF